MFTILVKDVRKLHSMSFFTTFIVCTAKLLQSYYMGEAQLIINCTYHFGKLFQIVLVLEARKILVYFAKITRIVLIIKCTSYHVITYTYIMIHDDVAIPNKKKISIGNHTVKSVIHENKTTSYS